MEEILKEILGELKTLNNRVGKLYKGQEHEDKFIDAVEKVDLLNTKFERLETKLNQVAVIQKDHSEILDLLAARSIRQEADLQTLKRAK